MRVSAIVPIYDGERYLAEALDSAFAQTRRADDVIAIDDGSHDASAAIVARYPGVRCIRQPNAGCAAARNRGVAAASGDVVAFLDQDDVWMPTHLATMVGALEQDPALDFVTCAVMHFLSPEMTGLPPGVEPAMLTAPQHGMGTFTLVARRELFARVGPFDSSMVPIDDSEWLLRAIDVGARFAHLDTPGVRHRIHATNQSHLARGTPAHVALMARALHASLKRRRAMS
jgi:glycosyltransferase involved in cell wall biosynthesis